MHGLQAYTFMTHIYGFVTAASIDVVPSSLEYNLTARNDTCSRSSYQAPNYKLCVCGGGGLCLWPQLRIPTYVKVQPISNGMTSIV
mgnify:CR=1 FL=1